MLGNVKIEEKTMQHIFQSAHEVEKKMEVEPRGSTIKGQTSVVLVLCHIKLTLYLHKLN